MPRAARRPRAATYRTARRAMSAARKPSGRRPRPALEGDQLPPYLINNHTQMGRVTMLSRCSLVVIAAISFASPPIARAIT